MLVFRSITEHTGIGNVGARNTPNMPTRRRAQHAHTSPICVSQQRAKTGAEQHNTFRITRTQHSHTLTHTHPHIRPTYTMCICACVITHTRPFNGTEQRQTHPPPHPTPPRSHLQAIKLNIHLDASALSMICAANARTTGTPEREFYAYVFGRCSANNTCIMCHKHDVSGRCTK